MDKNCDFCNELILSNRETYAGRIHNFNFSRILYENKSFIVVPSLGEVEKGHLLIIPKRHVTAMLLLSSPEKVELTNLVRLTIKLFKQKLNTEPIFFEHGIIDKRQKEQRNTCTDHAHLHVLPRNVDLLDDISNNLTLITYKKNIDFNIKLACDYIYYIDGKGAIHYFTSPRIESQIIRKIYAKKIKAQKKMDWKKCINIDETLSATLKYQKYFLHFSSN